MDAHQTSIYNAILICGSIIGAIIIYFIVSIIYQHRRNRHLYKRSLEAEIKLLEKERSRIAADLHDDLGPLLSSIKLKVGSFDLYSDTDKKTADRVYEHIDSLMQRMRDISADMLPSTLERKGLVAAVNEFMDSLPGPSKTAISFEHPGLGELPISKSIHLYRIIQEIIHNTIKHAKAKNMQIGFSEEDNSLLLLAKDDGIGFNVEAEKEKSGGLGLKSLESRCEILNGVLNIESKPGFGTNYFVKIPLFG